MRAAATGADAAATGARVVRCALQPDDQKRGALWSMSVQKTKTQPSKKVNQRTTAAHSHRAIAFVALTTQRTTAAQQPSKNDNSAHPLAIAPLAAMSSRSIELKWNFDGGHWENELGERTDEYGRLTRPRGQRGAGGGKGKGWSTSWGGNAWGDGWDTQQPQAV